MPPDDQALTESILGSLASGEFGPPEEAMAALETGLSSPADFEYTSPRALISSNMGLEIDPEIAAYSEQAKIAKALQKQREAEAAQALASARGDQGPTRQQLVGQALLAFLPALAGYAGGGRRLASTGAGIGAKIGADYAAGNEAEIKRQQQLDLQRYKDSQGQAAAAGSEAKQFELAGTQAAVRNSQFKQTQQDRRDEYASKNEDRDLMRQVIESNYKTGGADGGNKPAPLPLREALAAQTGKPVSAYEGYTVNEINQEGRIVGEGRRLASEDRAAQLQLQREAGIAEIVPADKELVSAASQYGPLRNIIKLVTQETADKSQLALAVGRQLPILSGGEVQSLDQLSEFAARSIRGMWETGIMSKDDAESWVNLLKRPLGQSDEVYLRRINEVTKNNDRVILNKIKLKRESEGQMIDPILTILNIDPSEIEPYPVFVEKRLAAAEMKRTQARAALARDKERQGLLMKKAELENQKAAEAAATAGVK